MTDQIEIRTGREHERRPPRGGIGLAGGGALLTWDRDELIRILPECRGVMTVAAKRVGVHSSRIYEHARLDPEWGELFHAALHDAREQTTDLIENRVLEMAIDGHVETTIEHGHVTRQVRKYDPKLALRVLEIRRPEQYHLPERLEHTGAGGGPIEIDFKMSDRDLPIEAEAEEIQDAELEEGDTT